MCGAGGAGAQRRGAAAAGVGAGETTPAGADDPSPRRTAGASEAPDASSNDDEQKAGVLTTLIRSEILRQAAVPLRVVNAFEPHDPGTLIDDEPAERHRVEQDKLNPDA